MNISEYSVRRPITVLMITASVIVLGIISLKRLPLDLLPEFSPKRLVVSVSYPSSSPQEVERNISRPLEEQFGTLEHLDSMRATSSSTGSSVRLAFHDSADMDLVALEIRDRIDRVRNLLPDDVERVAIRRWSSTDIPIFEFALGWSGDRETLYRIARQTVSPRLARIDGVAEVSINGLRERQIIVDLDQNLLDATGIDVWELRRALAANNLNVSGGFVEEAGRRYTLRTVGEFASIEEISNLPLAGGRLLLSDVARVRYDYPEVTRVSRLNGEESISFEINKVSTANVIDVCLKLREELDSLLERPEFAGQMTVQIYRDQSEEILKSLNDLKVAGIFGGLLAMSVLFLFLRKFRSTLIISLAIPVSIVFAFGFMYLLRVFGGSNITLNVVSLMGLMVAIGMLLDASIVVLENIFRYKQEKGLEAREAAVRGSREVGMAVLASTATTVIVFVSFFFGTNSLTGRFTGAFGLSVSVALVASLLVAVTLVPLLSSRIFTGREKPRRGAMLWLNRSYAALMTWLLGWRVIALVAMCAIGYLTVSLFGSIDRDLFSRASERQLRLSVFMEKSFSLEEMSELYAELEEVLLEKREELDILAISSNFSNRTSSFGGRSNRSAAGQFRGRINVYLKDEGQITRTAVLQERIRELLPPRPGVEFSFERRRYRGHGAEMGVEVQLLGENPSVLGAYAELVRERLEGVAGVNDVETTLESGDEEIHLRVDRQRSESFGVSSRAVAQTISSALSTRASTYFKAFDEEIDVILQLRGGNDISLQELQNMRFLNRSGEMVPLNAVVDYSYERGPRAITREDRQSRVSVVANTDGAGMLGMQMQVEEALAGLQLPPGYAWSMGSQWGDFRRAESESFFALALALIFMYIVMAALFESFTQPFTILFSVPFSLIGVAVIFHLTQTRIDQMAYLGILVLFGIVVNNGIILVNHIKMLRDEGLERNRAIVQGGVDRLRPILMTALTSIIGLLPLTLPVFLPDVFGALEGRSRQWSPVSLAVLGGLTTSTFLTLIILPTVYSYVDDLTRVVSGLCRSLWSRRSGASEVSA